MSGSSPAVRARRAAEPFSRRVTSSDSSSSRKSACGSCCWRARVSRSGRVARSWPSLRVRRCRLRSGLTGSARVIGRPFIVDLTVLAGPARCRGPGGMPGPRRPRSPRRLAAAGAVAARSRGLVPGAAVGLRVLPAVAGGRGWPAGEDVVQQAGEAVLFGALAVQGGLVAGELVAQRGDGVVCGGQLRGGGGELGGMPLLVLLAGAGSIRAGLPGGGHGGVALGAGGGEGLFCFGDPGCGCPAFVVQGTVGVAGTLLGVLACGGLCFHRGDGLGGGGAGLGGVQLGGVPGDRLGGGLGAGLPDLGGGLGADCLGLRFGGLKVAGRGELAAEGGELVQRGG